MRVDDDGVLMELARVHCVRHYLRDVSLALQVIVTGLAAGGVYGLVAVGYSLIYRLTGIVHFAFGELIALGVFVTLLVAAGTGPVTQATARRRRFVVALVVGVGVCVAAGAGSYLFAVQPYLARGSTIGWVAAITAVAFAIRAMLAAVFTRPSYVFPDPLPFRDVGRDGFVTIGGASIQVRAFFVIAVAVALAAAATWALERTRVGPRAAGDRLGLRRARASSASRWTRSSRSRSAPPAGWPRSPRSSPRRAAPSTSTPARCSG